MKEIISEKRFDPEKTTAAEVKAVVDKMKPDEFYKRYFPEYDLPGYQKKFKKLRILPVEPRGGSPVRCGVSNCPICGNWIQGDIQEYVKISYEKRLKLHKSRRLGEIVTVETWAHKSCALRLLPDIQQKLLKSPHDKNWYGVKNRLECKHEFAKPISGVLSKNGHIIIYCPDCDCYKDGDWHFQEGFLDDFI